MHELSICQALIHQVEKIVQECKAESATEIIIGLGPLSGVEVQLLKNAFPIASVGTVAEAAKLIINELPLRVKCDQCGSESEVTPNKLLCKNCGDWRTSLISGDELMLISVELEKYKEPVAVH
ncbi:MAG: hydrogenase maturation nickel metallochaperone HypA [Gammaproteobacteria bacterium]|nr:hydrogenase maturation nickel metallochaperone HypA [Gammaproteobacteria bacterium]